MRTGLTYEIEEHPTDIGKLPNNFEILVRGVSNSKALDFLFSSNLDILVEGLFKNIEAGNFEDVISNEQTIKKIFNSLFGEGSFEGPVSTRVLNSIQASMQSQKYQTMKSYLGKTVTILKKKRLIIKNLERQGKNIKDREELKKYKDAVYAIKRVLKLVQKIYMNRKIVNRKVYAGLNNLVHEDVIIDETLTGID